MAKKKIVVRGSKASSDAPSARPKDDGQLAPIVVSLGLARRTLLSKLTRGEGDLVEEVRQAIAQVREQLGDEAAGWELAPVVVIYEKEEDQSLFPLR